jgi:asparagine synthase (glutamine-hydrolysing)
VSAFVAAIGTRAAPVSLPDACVAALAVPGAQRPVALALPGFACAAAPTRRGESGVRRHGHVVVVGDVRIDARADLASALRAARTRDGHAPLPADADDLALVLAAHAAWREDAFGRLLGDFAFVLWDGGARQAWAVRDGMGVRPLYHAATAGAIIASNIIDAVRAHPDVGTGLNPAAIASFLAHGANLDVATTTFASVARLAPGTALAVPADGTPRVWRHWSVPDPAPTHLTDEACVERYRELLGRAVRDRMDPDGTAIFLSGGIDSPTIAATARRVVPGVRLEALTMRTTDVESGREMELAAMVAARLGIRQHRFESPTDARPEALRRTPEPIDEPEFAAQTEVLARLASVGGVIIEGEDGDALFRPAGLATMLRREAPLRVLSRIVAYTVRHRHHPYLGFWIARRLGLRPGDAPRPAPRWLRPTAREALPDDTGVVRTHRSRPEGVASLTAAIWQSVHAATDRAYHGAPVEFRWPLLDARLLEFVFALPSVPWCQRKYLARRAFAGELPPDVLARPKTTISGYHETMVRVWRDRTACALPPLDDRTLGFVDAEAVRTCLRAGDAEDVMEAWRVIELDAWIRKAGA